MVLGRLLCDRSFIHTYTHHDPPINIQLINRKQAYELDKQKRFEQARREREAAEARKKHQEELKAAAAELKEVGYMVISGRIYIYVCVCLCLQRRVGGFGPWVHIPIWTYTTPRTYTQAEAKAAQGGDDSDDEGGAAAAGPKDELADFFSEVRLVF